MKKKTFTDRELKTVLKKTAKSVSFAGKSDVKDILFSKIQSEQQSFVLQLQTVGKEVKLATQAKWLIKEILLAKVVRDRDWRWLFDWSKLWNFSGKWYGAVAMAFVFVLGIFVWPWQWGVNSALAVNYAVLEQFAGNVKINRKGVNIEGYLGMILLEGDEIKSTDGAKAELRFGNDNLVRLGENSRMLLSKLNVVGEHYPVVNFELLDGESWVRVFNVPGSEAEFEVKANDLLISANNRVAFDVKVTPEFSRVVAIDNNLDLVLSHHQQLIAATLQPEKMIKIRAKTPFISYQEQVRFEGTVSNDDLDWFERNLISDRVYLDSLENRWRDLVADRGGITPESSLYTLKEFKRKARLALTIDELNREEVRLDIATEQFYEAQKVLASGDKAGANKLLKSYQNNVALVSKKANELQDKDPARADALRRTIDASLLEQKQLLLPLENKGIYAQAKTIVETTKLNADKAEGSVVPTTPTTSTPEPTVSTGEVTNTNKLESKEESLATAAVSKPSLTDTTTVIPAKVLEILQPTELPKLDVLVESVTSLKDVKEKTGTQDQTEVKPLEEATKVNSLQQSVTTTVPVQSGVVIEVAPKTTTQ